ncbi:hypothetical protein CIRG_09185 [Coccidioides immitis RMSCC 2394]|uniref:Uncharacterized protein n=1 Tax=Coccidioides immitis RMSCC 2394 TaxID=404692 RepID=A0A0J7BHZ2_COCIT|nr:hypothetical protein CIRG_09185 [Coccidioides immitis RMSCC 2394]
MCVYGEQGQAIAEVYPVASVPLTHQISAFGRHRVRLCASVGEVVTTPTDGVRGVMAVVEGMHRVPLCNQEASVRTKLSRSGSCKQITSPVVGVDDSRTWNSSAANVL